MISKYLQGSYGPRVHVGVKCSGNPFTIYMLICRNPYQGKNKPGPYFEMFKQSIDNPAPFSVTE